MVIFIVICFWTMNFWLMCERIIVTVKKLEQLAALWWNVEKPDTNLCHQYGQSLGYCSRAKKYGQVTYCPNNNLFPKILLSL